MGAKYTNVEVKTRRDQEILYFLVVTEAKGAEAEMKRLIAARGSLVTNDCQKIKAATLDPASIIVRHELSPGVSGKVCAVDGTAIDFSKPLP